MKQKYIIGSIIGISLLVGGISTFVVYANPSYFASSLTTSSTSTLPVYMSPGKGTTTPVFDSYQVNQGSGTVQNPTKVNEMALMVQFMGSSTLSMVNIDVEYSQDQIKWYKDAYSFTATSTGVFNLSNTNSYVLPYASSTTIGGVASTTDTVNRIFKIATPTRYVRPVFTMPTGASTNGGTVWYEMVPVKERAE